MSLCKTRYNNTITGNELIDKQNSSHSAAYMSAYKALAEFYAGFNQADLEKVTNNWLQSEEVSMSNPLGDIKRGWQAIETVYNRIFNGNATVYVEFYDYSIHHNDNMFCAIGRERGYYRYQNKEIELAIRTTRIYTKNMNQWKQLHHHGSIDQPELLDQYQTLVKSR